MSLVRASALVGLTLLTGCTGRLALEGGDAGGVAVRDGETSRDAGSPTNGNDGGPPAPGTDAGPPAPGTDAGPGDPCAAVSCGANERCEASSGACVCQPGFTRSGADCVGLPPGDPAARSQADVCAEWRAGHVENAASHWSAGAGTCGAGTTPADAIDDTLRRVNLFRWLAGMPSVSYDGSDHASLQECAHMMSVNGDLSHSPPMSWDCWTSGGAAAAGRANIAYGYGSPGDAIDGFMADRDVRSLGHRRWILGTRLSSVEIGFSRGGSRPGQCLGVFSRGGSTERPWTAYPNPGFAPIAMIQSRFAGVISWSLQAHGFDVSSATAEVVRVSDGASLAVDSYVTGGGGPPRSVAFTPMGWTPTAGETYRVTIRGTGMGDISYETTLVDC